MNYQTRTEVEKIAKAGALSFNEFLGNRTIRRCRILSSFWLCTNAENDGIAEHLNTDGYWESWITYWVSNNVKPGSVCVDAGATYGYYTFFLAQHGCKVYSIEANPDLIPLLEYSNYLNGAFDRVTVINKAAYDKSGQHVYLGFSNSIGGTSVHANNDLGGVRVETMMLDELLLVERKIDFVKLDIASSEEKAWEGMQRIMQANPACLCIMEFSPAYYHNFGKDFFDRISSSYKVFYIDGDGIETPINDYRFFYEDMESWRMLVIRNRPSVTTNQSADIIAVLQSLD